MKRLVATAAAALLLAPAAPAFGKERLRAVSVCGPILCNIARDPSLVANMEKLFASEQRTDPAPVGPFFGVDTIMSGGSTGAGEFFPASGVLRWRPPSGKARWLILPARVAAALRTTGGGAGPYQPAVTQATAGGKPADDAAGYRHLFDDIEQASMPAGETIPLALDFKKVGPVVVLGNAAEWKQRVGIGERPAPAIEADDALKIGNRFALDRLAILGRLTQPLEARSAARPLPLGRHSPQA